uniref:Uncharacterized protein n=1 Tax=Candidatus Kentrum sp. TUN TaxID=2126343 RepID=A0A451A1Y1_9GAMM|nr:MAG: hypothetical protein BECKTUN1418F_GA0071002_11969 [Candidatus Kentron sp. TUN]VFK69305.1 MAG: hypothetical protein BECKTUN1418E_GA0071001_11939 [Candidatus Kentron sp. TUN]
MQRLDCFIVRIGRLCVEFLPLFGLGSQYARVIIPFADYFNLFISRSALQMSHPLAGPCQQGKQNPRGSSMRFLRCRKAREKPQYAPSVFNGKCRLSEYAKVEPSIIGI